MTSRQHPLKPTALRSTIENQEKCVEGDTMRTLAYAFALSLAATAAPADDGPLMSVSSWSAIYLCGFLDAKTMTRTSCLVDHKGQMVRAVIQLRNTSPGDFCEDIIKRTRANSAYFAPDWKLLIEPSPGAQTGVVTCSLKNT